MSIPNNRLDEVGMIRALNSMVKMCGTQAAFAEKAGVSQAYLSKVMNAAVPPSDKILSVLGIRRVSYYEFTGD